MLLSRLAEVFKTSTLADTFRCELSAPQEAGECAEGCEWVDGW